jgi:4-alpha-glucanotransferase
MKLNRCSGILLHVTALPTAFGIGDVGPSAYRFVDLLVSAKQGIWQILPFSIADKYGCPYSSYSAYGGYPLLISPEKLHEEGLLTKTELKSANGLFGDRVNYELVYEFKIRLFYQAYERFKKKKTLYRKFLKFVDQESDWIGDLATFLVLTDQFGKVWTDWPTKLRERDPDSIQRFREKNQDEIFFYKFLQFTFFKQWLELKEYANQNGIKLVGDIPIFLSHQSMDVWRNPELFLLANGEPYVVTGAPPDRFSAEGQKWGNPNYNWWLMEQDGFQWWIKRMAFNMRYYDIIRLDHFRGFSAVWEIPASNPDPRSGYWAPVPGHNLFHCLSEKLGELPVIAEDLGKITPDVLELRDRFNFPGMKILQFAFGEGDENINLPHNYESNNCVVYTGTHDNETIIGWYRDLGETLEKWYAYGYSQAWSPDQMNWTMIHMAMHSKADLCITPLQDIMGLDNNARFNIPGTEAGNWSWRFKWEDIRKEDMERFTRMVEDSWRVPAYVFNPKIEEKPKGVNSAV